MLVKDISKLIEVNAPLQSALGFDNVGLLVGDQNANVTGILVAVDVTRRTLQSALESGVNLIIAHHPIIFNPLKRLNVGNYVDEIVMEAIRENVNIYACHTNADNAKDGLNYNLLKRLGAENIEILCEDGTGCYGEIDCDIDELTDKIAKIIKGTAKIDAVPNRRHIRKIAIVTGCGGRDREIADRVFSIGADCYLTAEVAHNIRLEFIDKGINLVEVGHYESERIFVDIVSRWLEGVGVKKNIEYNDNFDN